MDIKNKKQQNIEKNLLGLQLIFLLMIFPGFFHILLAQDNKICQVEIREYPGHDPVMWDGVFAASDGKVYTGLMTEGSSAHFYMYDPIKETNILLYDIPDFLGERGKGIRTSGKLHNKPVEDNEGNIYIVPICNGSGPLNIDFTSWQGGHWLRYIPQKNKMEDLGLVDQGVGIYPLTIDKDRNLLFGIGFTGYLYKFDIKNRKTKNLGRVDNWDICRNIFADDRGNIYGSFPVSRIWKYDAETQRVTDLDLSLPYDPTIYPTQLRNPMIDRSTIWRAVQWDPVQKVAYGVTCGSGSILFRYDPHDGPQGKITVLSKMCDSKFLGSERKDIPYSPLSFALDSKNRKIYFVPSSRNFTIEGYVETFGSSEPHHLIMYDLSKDKRIDLGAMQTKDGLKVFGCEAATVGPDGTVYIVGQVELKNRKKASLKTDGNIPMALQLLIYKP